MKKLFLLIVLYLLYIFATQLTSYSELFVNTDGAASDLLSLGLLTTIAWYFGVVAQKLKLPAITGYLFAGVLFGPHILSQIEPSLVVLNPDNIKRLQIIDNLALGIIALTAGGELKLSMIKSQWKSLLAITVSQIIVVILGVSLAILLLYFLFPDMSPFTFKVAIGVSLLLGVVATGNSPATTIAVINECNSKGPVTDTALGVTVLKDMAVITIFTIVLALAELLILPNAKMDIGMIGTLSWEIFGSIGVGCLLGWFLSIYVDRVNKELPLVVLAVAFLSMSMFHELHLSGLLICMIAGFFLENFSKHGDALIHAIETHSLFVYLLFFSIAGASLDLHAFFQFWHVALFLVTARLLFTWLGTSVPAKYTNPHISVRKYAWLGFISQAGVSLGFAIILERAFKDVNVVVEGSTLSLGELLKTVILGTIVVNQLLGPVAFTVALAKSDEINAAPDADKPLVSAPAPAQS